MTTLEFPPKDGLGGTDNVTPLFAGAPSAAPLPPQQDVVSALHTFLEGALLGRITGLAIVTFDEHSQPAAGAIGKCPYVTLIGALENLKVDIMVMEKTGKPGEAGK